MKVLVTGGFGYLGGRFADHLQQQPDIDVVVGSRRSTPSVELNPDTQFAQTLWQNPKSLDHACSGIDVVVHTAGMNAQDCAKDPDSAFQLNAMATRDLARAARRQGVRKFVYLSTAHVYASPLQGRYSETSPLTNEHPYATTHRAGEIAVLEECTDSDMEGYVMRLSNTFGPPTDLAANCWMLVLNDASRQIVEANTVRLKSSGRQLRDFVPISYVCEVVKFLALLPQQPLGDGIVNVGAGRSVSVLTMIDQLADHAAEVTGIRPDVLVEAHQEEQILPMTLQTTKMRSAGMRDLTENENDNELRALLAFCYANFPPT